MIEREKTLILIDAVFEDQVARLFKVMCDNMTDGMPLAQAEGHFQKGWVIAVDARDRLKTRLAP